ncbi:transposase [Caballeronia sp. M23-90]
MTDITSELKARLIVGRKQDGRCVYDPKAKRELIEACKVPGVSVARLALDHGLNANLLRTWVTADKKRRASTGIVPVAKTLNPAAAAFIPVIPTQAQPRETAPRLEVRFPNGIKAGFDDARDDQLLSLLATLSTLPCFDSTKA